MGVARLRQARSGGETERCEKIGTEGDKGDGLTMCKGDEIGGEKLVSRSEEDEEGSFVPDPSEDLRWLDPELATSLALPVARRYFGEITCLADSTTSLLVSGCCLCVRHG